MTAGGAPHATNILMYHSIGAGPGPLSIEPRIFKMQMDALERRGFRGVALRDYLPHRAFADRLVVLTFDDGYDDCAEVAVRDLERRGWNCTIFLSSGLVGAQWDPDGAGARTLIDWPSARALAARGVEIGAHGVGHTDLTTLSPLQACDELLSCKEVVERDADCHVTSFAAPYGHTTPALRLEISRHYACAVGTTMAQATAASDPYDLPRIEMWYFRDANRWHEYLDGATSYFSARRGLRRIGRIMKRSSIRR